LLKQSKCVSSIPFGPYSQSLAPLSRGFYFPFRQFLTTTRAPCRSVIFAFGHLGHAAGGRRLKTKNPACAVAQREADKDRDRR
jgi:hypothetical protein